MLKRLERILFFSLFLALPIQLGRHFWPSVSFVQGIRVDYLSPTLYATDILIILLFCLVLFQGKIHTLFSPLRTISGISLRVSLFFILGVFLSLFISRSPLLSLYGVARFVEMLFLVFYIKHFFLREDIIYAIDCFALAAVYESVISWGQFIFQHSLGGIFYFLGERSFTVLTPGIASVRIPSGLLLRPYGTFSHPNVLAFFLLFTCTLLLSYIPYEKQKREKIFLILVFFISSLTLIISLSRIVILCFIGICILFFIRRIGKKVLIGGVLGAFLLFLLLPFFFARVLSIGSDWEYRVRLMVIGLSLFQKSPLFGIGLLQFYSYEVLYQKTFSPIFLQPVHNIFLLTLSELGVIGFLSLLYGYTKLIARLTRAFLSNQKSSLSSLQKALLLLLVSIGIIGMTDHFFLTLYQGQLLATLIVGFSWWTLSD